MEVTQDRREKILRLVRQGADRRPRPTAAPNNATIVEDAFEADEDAFEAKMLAIGQAIRRSAKPKKSPVTDARIRDLLENGAISQSPASSGTGSIFAPRSTINIHINLPAELVAELLKRMRIPEQP